MQDVLDFSLVKPVGHGELLCGEGCQWRLGAWPRVFQHCPKTLGDWGRHRSNPLRDTGGSQNTLHEFGDGAGIISGDGPRTTQSGAVVRRGIQGGQDGRRCVIDVCRINQSSSVVGECEATLKRPGNNPVN
jgi:hypothetical protein